MMARYGETLGLFPQTQRLTLGRCPSASSGSAGPPAWQLRLGGGGGGGLAASARRSEAGQLRRQAGQLQRQAVPQQARPLAQAPAEQRRRLAGPSWLLPAFSPVAGPAMPAMYRHQARPAMPVFRWRAPPPPPPPPRRPSPRPRCPARARTGPPPPRASRAWSAARGARRGLSRSGQPATPRPGAGQLLGWRPPCMSSKTTATRAGRRTTFAPPGHSSL
jgi:hypothetical protein